MDSPPLSSDKFRLVNLERSISLNHPKNYNGGHNFVHMEKDAGKLKVSKGDEFNFLPEDEM